MTGNFLNLNDELHHHIVTARALLDVIETLAESNPTDTLQDEGSLYMVAFTAHEAVKEAERVADAMEAQSQSGETRPTKDLSRVVASVFHALQRGGIIETSASPDKIANLMESVFRAYHAKPESAEWVEDMHDLVEVMGGDFGERDVRREVYESVMAAIQRRREKADVIRDGAPQPDSSGNGAPTP